MASLTLGPCIRCNLQMEGSGVSPDDVVVDVGRRQQSGNGGPGRTRSRTSASEPTAPTASSLRNITVRHAEEHGIYVARDRRLPARPVQGLLQRGVRRPHLRRRSRPDARTATRPAAATPGSTPGAGADTGRADDRGRPSAATARRSASATCTTTRPATPGPTANAVHVHHNDFYDNANGFTTDVFTAARSPRLPPGLRPDRGQRVLLEQLQPLPAHCGPGETRSERAGPGCSDVTPTVPAVGTGHVDRRRQQQHDPEQLLLGQLAPRSDAVRGSRLLRLRPDPARSTLPRLRSPPSRLDLLPEPLPRQHDGPARPTASAQPERRRTSGGTRGLVVDPSNSGNCWFDNTGTRRHRRQRHRAPLAERHPPDNLPSDCDDSPLPGALHDQVAELLGCSRGTPSCPWFTTPPKPSP